MNPFVKKMLKYICCSPISFLDFFKLTLLRQKKMLKRITVGVSRLVGASWVRRHGRTFCPQQLVPPSSHRKIRYYKRKKGHIHNQSSRISRNKSAHRLESTKHSICCCWIILFAALSLSIVVYCRLCCSGWLNCALQNIELCFGSV